MRRASSLLTTLMGGYGSDELSMEVPQMLDMSGESVDEDGEGSRIHGRRPDVLIELHLHVRHALLGLQGVRAGADGRVHPVGFGRRSRCRPPMAYPPRNRPARTRRRHTLRAEAGQGNTAGDSLMSNRPAGTANPNPEALMPRPLLTGEGRSFAQRRAGGHGGPGQPATQRNWGPPTCQERCRSRPRRARGRTPDAVRDPWADHLPTGRQSPAPAFEK